MRHVFVLSREHPWSPWLYEYLHERFGNDPCVEIVIDRRIAERRARVVSTLVARERRAERRATERRRALGPEDDLRLRSHYIVEL